MKEYEVVHEIFNECANNQMRDVFFEEVALDDPEQYIRSRHKDRELKIEREDLEDGTIVYHVETSGIAQKHFYIIFHTKSTSSHCMKRGACIYRRICCYLFCFFR